MYDNKDASSVSEFIKYIKKSILADRETLDGSQDVSGAFTLGRYCDGVAVQGVFNSRMEYLNTG